MMRFGVAGHRTFGDERVIDFMISQCMKILSKAQTRSSKVTAFSAAAEGADTIFAETALALNIPLVVVRPFKNYAHDFKTSVSLSRYENLCKSAAREIELPYRNRSNLAYRAAMHWIVDNCDVLVAAWNGEISGQQVGGTKDAIDRAIQVKRDWIHIDINELSVNFHY